MSSHSHSIAGGENNLLNTNLLMAPAVPARRGPIRTEHNSSKATSQQQCLQPQKHTPNNVNMLMMSSSSDARTISNGESTSCATCKGNSTDILSQNNNKVSAWPHPPPTPLMTHSGGAPKRHPQHANYVQRTCCTNNGTVSIDSNGIPNAALNGDGQRKSSDTLLPQSTALPHIPEEQRRRQQVLVPPPQQHTTMSGVGLRSTGNGLRSQAHYYFSRFVTDQRILPLSVAQGPMPHNLTPTRAKNGQCVAKLLPSQQQPQRRSLNNDYNTITNKQRKESGEHSNQTLLQKTDTTEKPPSSPQLVDDVKDNRRRSSGDSEHSEKKVKCHADNVNAKVKCRERPRIKTTVGNDNSWMEGLTTMAWVSDPVMPTDSTDMTTNNQKPYKRRQRRRSNPNAGAGRPTHPGFVEKLRNLFV